MTRRASAVDIPAQGAPGWRAALLLTAPHKLCFFAAGWHWAGAALWWWYVLAAPGGPPAWHLAPPLAHGLWFTLGPMPLFIAGFMFTAGPKWLRQAPVDARALLGPVAIFNAGWTIAVAGFHLDGRVTAAGLAVAACAWAPLAWRMLRLVASSDAQDRLHAGFVAAAALVLFACLAAGSVALAAGRAHLLRAVVQAALWWGLALVFIAVSHRMLPFFGDGACPRLDARWPRWTLWLLASVPLARGGEAIAAAWLPPPAPWRWMAAFHLATVAAVSLRLALRWIGTPPLRQPMVAMLFRPLLWWAAALGLGALSHVPALEAGWSSRLAAASLHALTIGYLGGTMLAMVTRVSSTHGGRPRAVDAVAGRLEILLQLTAAARVAAALWPAAATVLLPAAASGWVLVAGAWAVRHGRWLGRPRADGR